MSLVQLSQDDDGSMILYVPKRNFPPKKKKKKNESDRLINLIESKLLIVITMIFMTSEYIAKYRVSKIIPRRLRRSYPEYICTVVCTQLQTVTTKYTVFLGT